MKKQFSWISSYFSELNTSALAPFFSNFSNLNDFCLDLFFKTKSLLESRKGPKIHNCHVHVCHSRFSYKKGLAHLVLYFKEMIFVFSQILKWFLLIVWKLRYFRTVRSKLSIFWLAGYLVLWSVFSGRDIWRQKKECGTKLKISFATDSRINGGSRSNSFLNKAKFTKIWKSNFREFLLISRS